MSEPRGYKDTTVFQRPAGDGIKGTDNGSPLVKRSAVVLKLREALSRTGNRDAQLTLNRLIKEIQEL